MSFAQQIASFSDRTKARLTRIRRQVCIKLFSAVILDTPVDTGRLRGNWQLTQDAPAGGTLTTEDKGGLGTITAMSNAVNASKNTVVLYLTNNLPYAARIEFDGWSHTKAPEGMVRRNVVRFNGLISATNEENKNT